MKTFTLLKAKYFSKDTSSSERLEKNKVRASIEAYCQEFIKSSDDILTFEALSNAIAITIAVIEEEPLVSRYNIFQVTETLFEVQLKELNIM